MSLNNIKRKFGYGRYSSDRFPWHCFRSFHLCHGIRAYNVWKKYIGFTSPEEYYNSELWKDYFPLKDDSISYPTYIQLSLFDNY